MKSYTNSNEYVIIKKDEPRFPHGASDHKSKTYAIARLEQIKEIDDVDCEQKIVEIVSSMGVIDRSYLSKVAVEEFQSDYLKNQELKLFLEKQRKHQMNEKRKQTTNYDDFSDEAIPIVRPSQSSTLSRLRKKRAAYIKKEPSPVKGIEGLQTYESSTEDEGD